MNSRLPALYGPLVALGLLLVGCGLTPQGDAVRAVVADRGAQAYDEGLANNEWFLCRVASVGSILRRYCRSADSCKLYWEFCHAAIRIDELIPVEAE